MTRYITIVCGILLLANLLLGCGSSNISDHPGGKITEPTKLEPTIIPKPDMIPEPQRTEPEDIPEPPTMISPETSVPSEIPSTASSGTFTD